MSSTTAHSSAQASHPDGRSRPASPFSRSRRSLITGACAVAICLAAPVAAQKPPEFDNSAANLMVVLRESSSQNRQEEGLKPMGKATVKLANNETVEVDTGWYEYLGDMHIRFVFDGPSMMINATPQDLQRLKLTPEAALALAVENIKRVYGKPKAEAVSGGLMQVGGAPDLNSSYFLDREFWEGLSKQYPEGIVAAPAKRGGLLYAPFSDARAVETLSKGVANLHQSSGRMRVSSALYLFRNGRWTVFQAPVSR